MANENLNEVYDQEWYHHFGMMKSSTHAQWKLYVHLSSFVSQTPEENLFAHWNSIINEKEKDLSINANLEGDAQIIGETSMASKWIL